MGRGGLETGGFDFSFDVIDGLLRNHLRFGLEEYFRAEAVLSVHLDV